MSELEQIRTKLDLTLDQMAEAMGVAHSTVHRWESAPDTKSSRKALEEAKALYKRRTRTEWKAQAAGGQAVTREEIAELYDAVEDCVAVIRALLQSLPEGSRPLALPKRFR